MKVTADIQVTLVFPQTKEKEPVKVTLFKRKVMLLEVPHIGMELESSVCKVTQRENNPLKIIQVIHNYEMQTVTAIAKDIEFLSYEALSEASKDMINCSWRDK